MKISEHATGQVAKRRTELRSSVAPAPSPQCENVRDRRLPARLVCERYDIVRRTLDRWIDNEALGFPRPIVINKRRYFREHELEAWERQRAQAA
jgi:hypothetical protein